MEIKRLTIDKINEIKKLYDDIKRETFTLWDDGYPSEDLIKYDIERNGLWGVFNQEDELIAISFAGERCEDGEEDYTWQQTFKKRGTFARIGVSPKYQKQGIASFLLEFILKELKIEGFDGVRILVGIKNINAIKLYEKFNFNNCGKIKKYGHEYYLFELKI